MPTNPIDVTRRSHRWSEQRWLLDKVINLIGPEWDQYRFAAWGSACGHDSQGDFIGLRKVIKTYNDMTREIMKAARRRELRAEAELKQGHEWSARESFFTAQVLYGGAQWSIEANTPLNLDLNKKKTACYAEFMKLAGRHIEQLDMPFEGRQLPAIFSLPSGYKEGDRLPCVVIITGMDGWKELSVAMDGDKFLQRGFAVLAIDGPGQGEALIREIWFDPNTYSKLGSSAFDFVAARPEVDRKRIVVHGLSFGSYWSSLLVASEPRFAACGVAMTCFEPDMFSIFETASPTFNLRFMYMIGAETEDELDRVRKECQSTEKLAPNITCPFLVAVGEDDQLTDLGDTFKFINNLAGPKSMILFEGEDHDIHGNQAGQHGPPAFTMVADWLTDRVRGVEMKSTYTEVDATGQVHFEPWGDKREYTYGIIENTKRMVFGS